MKKTLFVLAVLSAITASSAPARAATDTYRYKAFNAEASFWTEGLCSFTSVYVGASEAAVKEGPGKPTAESPQVWVYLSSFDWCAGTDTEAFGGATLAPGAFSHNKLDAASLDVTVTMIDWATNATFDLTIDLDWTGLGETYRGLDRSHYQGPGFSVNSRWNGTAREATVAGSITDASTDYAAGAEVYGDLSNVTYGATSITH